MPLSDDQIRRFLSSVHPWDSLPPAERDALGKALITRAVTAGEMIYKMGDDLPGQFLVHEGLVEISDDNGAVISHLGPRNTFGERGLLRDGRAATTARAESDTVLVILPRADVLRLIGDHDLVAAFFNRSRGNRQTQATLATAPVETVMSHPAATCERDTTAQDAARQMRVAGISSLCVVEEDKLIGIVTLRDIAGQIVAEDRPALTPVGDIMTRNPLGLPPEAIGSDVLHAMLERHIGHIPILRAGKVLGMVTQTDLTRFQAVSSGELVRGVAQAKTIEQIAASTAELPALLMQLVAGGHRHEVVTRLITDIADTATRRLLALGEAKLGPPPVPYLWLACGSQGRQEQTGVSDQDNCMMVDDAVTDDEMAYFHELARFVCDGLNAVGYVHCPGDMMAMNPMWCQPVRVWREHFTGWIKKPDPAAQMLASVMFDLRPISGDVSLFEEMQAETLALASKNSIFVAHMLSNSLKHSPPLSLFRGFATIRSGEHRNTIDLKHNGVVPIVDLGRIQALRGQITAANTRARLTAAKATGAISASGASDLIDAYDLIAETRLAHQARLIRQGEKPDNFLAPSALSDFERSQLRDAFVVVKSLQSALGHGKGTLG